MNMLALTIILPLIGFVLLAFSRGRWSENVSAIVGVGSVGLANRFLDSVQYPYESQ